MKRSTQVPFVVHEAAFYFHSGSEVPKFATIPQKQVRIELVIGGRGWVRHEDGLVEVGAGDLLWHMPGDETICRSDPTDQYSCLNVRFGFEGKLVGRDQPHLSHWENIESVRSFSEEVVRRFVDDSVDRKGLALWLYGSLIIESRKRIGRALRKNLSAKTRRVLACLEDESRQRLSLKQIADEVEWSLSHLHAVFRREVGTTPHEIVQVSRMRRSKQLLASTVMSIKEVAVECGYGNSAAFCNTFRERIGETPTEWRLRNSGAVS